MLMITSYKQQKSPVVIIRQSIISKERGRKDKAWTAKNVKTSDTHLDYSVQDKDNEIPFHKGTTGQPDPAGSKKAWHVCFFFTNWKRTILIIGHPLVITINVSVVLKLILHKRTCSNQFNWTSQFSYDVLSKMWPLQTPYTFDMNKQLLPDYWIV